MILGTSLGPLFATVLLMAPQHECVVCKRDQKVCQSERYWTICIWQDADCGQCKRLCGRCEEPSCENRACVRPEERCFGQCLPGEVVCWDGECVRDQIRCADSPCGPNLVPCPYDQQKCVEHVDECYNVEIVDPKGDKSKQNNAKYELTESEERNIKIFAGVMMLLVVCCCTCLRFYIKSCLKKRLERQAVGLRRELDQYERNLQHIDELRIHAREVDVEDVVDESSGVSARSLSADVEPSTVELSTYHTRQNVRRKIEGLDRNILRLQRNRDMCSREAEHLRGSEALLREAQIGELQSSIEALMNARRELCERLQQLEAAQNDDAGISVDVHYTGWSPASQASNHRRAPNGGGDHVSGSPYVRPSVPGHQHVIDGDGVGGSIWRRGDEGENESSSPSAPPGGQAADNDPPMYEQALHQPRPPAHQADPSMPSTSPQSANDEPAPPPSYGDCNVLPPPPSYDEALVMGDLVTRV